MKQVTTLFEWLNEITLYKTPPEEISQDSWDGFVEMRKKIKKPLTDRACTGIINKLDKFGKQNADAILDQSTENCWQTVYELKEQQPQQQENPWGLL